MFLLFVRGRIYFMRDEDNCLNNLRTITSNNYSNKSFFKFN